MTDLLEKAVETARSLAPDLQDDLARVVLALAGGGEPVVDLTPEEEADLEDAMAEMARGEFATEEQVKAVFAKYRA